MFIFYTYQTKYLSILFVFIFNFCHYIQCVTMYTKHFDFIVVVDMFMTCSIDEFPFLRIKMHLWTTHYKTEFYQLPIQCRFVLTMLQLAQYVSLCNTSNFARNFKSTLLQHIFSVFTHSAIAFIFQKKRRFYNSRQDFYFASKLHMCKFYYEVINGNSLIQPNIFAEKEIIFM